MKYVVFLNTLFLLICFPAFSQRQYSTYQKDGYVGLEFVETHTKITLPIYEKITPLLKTRYEKMPSSIYNDVYKANEKGFFLVCSNHSWSSIYSDNDIHFWKVVKDGKCGIINKKGITIVPTRYDDILGLIDTNFVLISKDNKTGVVHKNGTILISPVYDRIVYSESSDGHFILKAYSGTNFSLINETATILSTFPATLDADIQENHVILTNKYSQLKGASTLYGQEILPLVYNDLNLSFNIFSFKKDGEVGLMDLTGKRIFSSNRNQISHITNTRNIIDISYKAYQLVDNAGATLCADTFSTVSVHDDFMIVKIKSTGKSGILSFDGIMIIPAIYQSLDFWNEMLVAKKEDKYGIINISGNILLPFRYQKILIGSKDIPYLLVKQKGKYGCIDKQLQTVLPFKYQQLYYIYYANGNTRSQEAVRIVSIKGTTKGVVAGVIDLHGKIKIPYQDTYFIGKKNETYDPNNPISFRSDYIYCEKIINPVDKTRDCIILNQNMQEILRCYSRSLRVYDDYFLLTWIDRKYGMIAADGIIVIPFIYNNLYPFGYNHFYAEKNRYVGLLNRSGDTSIDFQYSSLRYFSDEYIIARDTNSIPKCGLIDYSGNIQVPFEYMNLQGDKKYYTNLLVAKKDTLYGLIDTTNSEVIPFMYEYIEQVNATFFHVQKNGKHGLITIDNKIIIPIIYEELSRLYDNAIRVKKDGKYGILNEKNYVVIPLEYDDIYPQTLSSYNYDKIFLVKKMDKIGSMDNTGKTILPIEFSSIDIYDNVSVVCKNSIYYFANGSVVNYNEPYEEITMNGNIFRTKNNGKHGIADYTGRAILNSIYDKINYAFEGFAVEKDGQTATFDKYGKLIVPFK